MFSLLWWVILKECSYFSSILETQFRKRTWRFVVFKKIFSNTKKPCWINESISEGLALSLFLSLLYSSRKSEWILQNDELFFEIQKSIRSLIFWFDQLNSCIHTKLKYWIQRTIGMLTLFFSFFLSFFNSKSRSSRPRLSLLFVFFTATKI